MRMFQVKIGIRNMVMPGARSVMIVVIMFTAPRMVPRPEITSPTTHMFAPAPGLCCESLSGGYPVQPKSGPPPGVRKPPTTIRPPNRYSQYAAALSRGNATSGAPICSGTM